MIREGRTFHGIDAVIDKDLASAKLADEVGVHIFVIATDVPGAALRYGTTNERFLKTMTTTEAHRYLAEEQFPAGSMGPKIRAAIDFVSQGGEECIITSTERVPDALEGKAGTRIVSAWQGERLAFEGARP